MNIALIENKIKTPIKSLISGGMYVASITPFDENGDVDVYALQSVIEYVLAGGCDGYVVAGTTGEARSLNTKERTVLLCFP